MKFFAYAVLLATLYSSSCLAHGIAFTHEMFNDHGAVMLLIDAQTGAIIDANEAAADFYGHTGEKLRRMTIQQINSLTEDEVLQERQSAVAEKRNFFLFRHRLANGDIRPVEVYSWPVLIDQKTVLFSIVHDVTHRDTFQSDLAQDEARLRHAERVAGFGHWTLDLESGVYTLSSGAEEILGLSGRSWDYQTIQSLFLPEYRANMEEARGELIKHGESQIHVKILRPIDSKVVDIHSHARRDASGMIFGIVQDVTEHIKAINTIESQTRSYTRSLRLGLIFQFTVIFLLAYSVLKRRTAERALLESQKRFREMFTTIRMAAVILDIRGRVTFCNDFLLEITGWRREEMMRAEWFELIPGEIRDEIRTLHAEMITTGSCPTHFEKEILTKNGERRLIAWNNTVLRDAKGKITGTASLGDDVTERRRMEATLRESQLRHQRLSEEFQAVLDGIPDSLCLIDDNGRIGWANRGTADRIGLKTDPTGLTCREVFCLRESCGYCPVFRSFSSGRTESGQMSTSDGQTWGIKAFPLLDAEGHTRQIIRWGSDITERIRMEEDAMRAARLASLGELAAGVAHEVNNPNGLILLNTALFHDVFADLLPHLEERFREQGDFMLGGLRYGRLRQELPLLFTETLSAGQRIRSIVEDLKNFARMEITDHSEIDVNESVRAAIRLVGPTLIKSTSFFKESLSANLPPVQGNAQRLEQILINLLMNACQALPDNSRGITVITRLNDDRREVVVEVRDQGVGISAEIFPQITDPFFTTRRQSGGIGLGLAVSTRIAKEHGGRLTFTSPAGEGTTVTLSIPVSTGGPK